MKDFKRYLAKPRNFNLPSCSWPILPICLLLARFQLVFAQPSSVILSIADTLNGAAGDTVEVPVMLDRGGNDIAALGAAIKATNNVLTFVDFTAGPIIPGAVFDVGAPAPDSLRLGFFDAGGGPITQDGLLVTLRFQIDPNATVGTMSLLHFSALTASDPNIVNLAIASVSGEVTVGEGLLIQESLPISQTGFDYDFVTGGGIQLGTLNFSTLGSVTSATVQAFLDAPPPKLLNAIHRYYNLSTNGTGYDVTITLHYTDDEVEAAGLVNGDANLQLYRYDGSQWIHEGGTVDIAANSITLSGVTQFSLWGMGDPPDTAVTSTSDNSDLPKEFRLSQNYPNPFNPITTISYELPHTVHITLTVYNILGQEAAALVNQEQQPGQYQVRFDAADLSSGVYLYSLKAGKFTSIKRMVLLK